MAILLSSVNGWTITPAVSPFIYSWPSLHWCIFLGGISIGLNTNVHPKDAKKVNILNAKYIHSLLDHRAALTVSRTKLTLGEIIPVWCRGAQRNYQGKDAYSSPWSDKFHLACHQPYNIDASKDNTTRTSSLNTDNTRETATYAFYVL